MAKKAAVRHGDPTTTGGVVLAFLSTISDKGKKVALSGEDATCGNCKGTYKILGTGKGIFEGGRDVVVDGDQVLCPCGKNRVIVGASPGIFFESTGGSAASTLLQTGAIAPSPTSVNRIHTIRFQAVEPETGNAIPWCAYILTRVNGDQYEGVTDQDGLTEIIETAQPEQIGVHFVFKSPKGDSIKREDLVA